MYSTLTGPDFIATSDMRLKDDIEDLPQEVIDTMKDVEFKKFIMRDTQEP